MSWGTVLRSFRPPFLLLTPVCVFLGVASASAAGLQVHYFAMWLAGAGALLAHIAVNTLNEYEDFESGLDLNTLRTPFSGGSGALPADRGSAAAVRAAALTALAGTVAIGLYFLWRQGGALLWLGLPGVLLIVSYTRWLNRMPWLCLVAPGAGFGISMVLGTQLVVAGELSRAGFAAALLVFFLVNNLLLLNQFPDIEADRSVGRNHFPIAYGVRASAWVYGVTVAAAIVTVLVAGVLQLFPPLGYWLVLPLLPGFYVAAGAMRHGGALGAHSGYLALNVAMTLLVPLLLGTVLLASA